MDHRSVYTLKEPLGQKMGYINHNPEAAGLCVSPEEYEYSSAGFYKSGEDKFGFLTHWMQ